jgi:hypothetical protein
MGSIQAAEPRISGALVFDRYTAWRSHVILGAPHGLQAITGIWIKNNLLASAKTIYNVRARIEYFHDGSLEFVIQSVSWWHEPVAKPGPLTWMPRIDLDANESQCVPVFMQPIGVTQLDPPYPQSAIDEVQGTRPLRAGRWRLRITITADAVEPITGEIEFTVYQQHDLDHLSIGCHPPMGDARLPVQTVSPVPAKSSKFRQFGFAGLCFLVAFVCWAIQKSDAAVNPAPSWISGLLWYGVAIAGVWSWDQTANRHVVVRSLTSVVVLAMMGWASFNPIRQEYRREHPAPTVQFNR